MNHLCVVSGAVIFGWLLPEFLLLLSPHADRFKRIPSATNLLSMVAFGLLAHGIAI